MTTLRDTLRATEGRLRDLRIRDAEAEGRILLAHVLDDTLSHLPTRLSEEASPELLATLDALLERRLHHEPLAYLTGGTEFMGLPFLCDFRALIPRADTETLVETALASLRVLFPPSPDHKPLILDMGTGSGCIGISIAHAMPHLRVVATDVSCEAVELAGENARLNDVDDRVSFLCGPDLDPVVEAGIAGEIEAVVSNPPYISRPQLAILEPEVVAAEPRVSFEGGATGLEFYQRVLPGVTERLPACQLVVFEFGFTQEDPILALVNEHFPGWKTEIRRDLSGIERVITATRGAIG